MRFCGVLGVLAVIMCPLVSEGAGQAAADAAAQKEIQQVLQLRLDALGRGDLGGYAAFVDARFIGVNDHGDRLDKPGLIKDVRVPPGQRVQSKESDFVVRSYGDAAVVSYKQSIVGAFYDELGITETYVRTNGHWLLVARQEIPVPFARHPPSDVDQALYDEYVGDYKITADWIVTISREGSKLYEKGPRDNSKIEDIPVSETTFVQKGETSILTFERDSTGKVVRLVLHFNNHDRVGTKIR